MVAAKPMGASPDDPNDPNVNTNDFVENVAGDILYQAQPLDVQTWLNEPGNLGDTTQVQINFHGNATSNWSGRLVYATDYLGNFYLIYPDLAPPAGS